jgi:CDP-4-dehydro-6-deoxyglucose reductase
MRVTLQPSGAVLDICPASGFSMARGAWAMNARKAAATAIATCAALLVEGRSNRPASARPWRVLHCIAEPLEDCIVLWDGVLALGVAGAQSVVSGHRVADVGGDTWRVRLRAPAGKPPRYHAGQYLMIERDNGEKSAFSLASAPHSGRDWKSTCWRGSQCAT